MKRLPLILLPIFLFTISARAQCVKYNGVASQSGRIITAGINSSSTALKTFPSATVTVFATGTTNLKSIFSDSACSISKGNPLTASSIDASYSFYILTSTIDLRFSGVSSGIAVPFTISAITIPTIGSTSIPCPAGSVNITEAPYNADNTGITDASSPIQDALNAGVKNICLPAQAQGTEGVYLFDPAARGHGGAFDMTTAQGDGVNIFAAGPVRLKLPASVTLADNISFIALTNGKNQSVHGFDFDGNTTVSGSFSVSGVSIGAKSYNSRVYDNRFFHFIGLSTAGSGLVTTYNGGDSATNISTTLGTSIGAGAQTVTPGSMDGIYVNRQLLVDGGTGSSELIFVTNITRTTLTATFANAHANTATVTGRAGYWQEAVVENNYFYDNYGATAIIVNSRGNRILNNTVVKVGLSANQHGIYIQAGDNLIQGNWIEGVYGYSFHQFSTGDGATDMSGNKYIGNWSIDPRTQHMIVEEAGVNVTNPLFPVGSSLDRYVTLEGNHFIKRSGNFSTSTTAGVELRVPATVTGNIFFDTTSSNSVVIAAAYLTVFSQSTVTGNIFGAVADPATNIAAQIINGRDPAGGTCAKACGVTVSANSFKHVSASNLIDLGPGSSITNNTFDDIPNDPGGPFPVIVLRAYSTASGNTARNMGAGKLLFPATLVGTVGLQVFGNTTDGPGNLTILNGLQVGEGAVLSISSNTIAPTSTIHHLGAGLLKTITLPAGFVNGSIQIVPDAAFTYDATSNILGTGTAVIGRTMIATYSSSSGKWSMSY